MRLDERGTDRGAFTFTLGAPVTGLIRSAQVPKGSLLYGRAYKTEDTEDEPHGLLRIIYDHVEIPGKGKFPVCVVSGRAPILELKDGTATAQANNNASPVLSWDPRSGW